jgi:hypothetical protein
MNHDYVLTKGAEEDRTEHPCSDNKRTHKACILAIESKGVLLNILLEY